MVTEALPSLLDLGLRGGRVLVLADGDCAFAATLARARPELHVCASTYDARRHVPEDHAGAVAELFCELDATEPLPSEGSWDRVVANFPVPVGRKHVARARAFLRRLLARAADALAEGGQAWLTLEDGVGGPSSDGQSWDVEDAAADAELVLVALRPAGARAVYAPRGTKTDGTLHVLARGADSPEAASPATLVRDVSLSARGTFEEFRREAAALCAPIEAAVRLLDSHVKDGCESWTVRLELRAPRSALSKRKAHHLCEAVETGRLVPLPSAQHPQLFRRPGWTVWFHKVEPSVEEFLSLVARPVERAEDARLLWTNSTWTHPTALVNHFDDAALNKRDVARLLRGTPFIPLTFSLPDEAEAWAAARRPYWIAKPARLGRGVSVVVFPDDVRPQVSGVVSEYVTPPLRIAGRKVDLRLYVLVLSAAPLKAFVHSNGYVRFAARPYSLEDFDPQRHLTNNAINRSAGLPPPPLPDQEVLPGDNWPLRYLWSHVDRGATWPRVRALVAGAMAAVAPELRTRPGSRPFALLGFDVLLTAGLEPRLCEINASPTLDGRRAIERGVGLEVLTDLLQCLEGGPVAERWEELQPGPAPRGASPAQEGPEARAASPERKVQRVGGE